MKNYLLLIAVFITLFTSCAKENQGCTPVNPSAEESQILAYAAAHSIEVTKHSSGMYYQIIDVGTGSVPSVESKVFITYTGQLLNGNQFDQATDPSKTGWYLNSLIEGWQLGLPLIREGGKIKLIIPSSLAYGCNSPGAGIPSNAVLYFDVSLVDVQ